MRMMSFLPLTLVASVVVIISAVICKPVDNWNENYNEEINVRKKRIESSSAYLEQCAPVNFSNTRQGFVNVLAFLDPAWPYSHRQAVMLSILKQRLEKSGLRDTTFFIINSDSSIPSQVIDTGEDDIEKEAWLGVSRDEIERFYDDEKLSSSLEKNENSDIEVIQDSQDLKIWENLGVSRDQILVIDRCGILTYQVIVPWSILHFPYVKAAILSTYKDEPCGFCDIANETHLQNNDIETSVTTDQIFLDTTNSAVTSFEEEESTQITEEIPSTLESTTIQYNLEENEEITTANPIFEVITDENNFSLNEDPAVTISPTNVEFFVDNKIEETTEMGIEKNYHEESSMLLKSRENLFDSVVDSITEEENLEQATSLPIRIIMHAPHFHTDTDSTRMHEYVVLRTSNAKIHGHLASQDATRLYSQLDDFREEIPDSKLTEEIEKKEWSMKNVIFKEEQASLFNNVPDYSWKDLPNFENYQDIEESDKMSEPQAYHENAGVNSWTSENSPNYAEIDGENLDSDTRTQVFTEQPKEEINTEEEETKNKLIAHYSKLLPWIYYVLDE